MFKLGRGPIKAMAAGLWEFSTPLSAGASEGLRQGQWASVAWGFVAKPQAQALSAALLQTARGVEESTEHIHRHAPTAPPSPPDSPGPFSKASSWVEGKLSKDRGGSNQISSATARGQSFFKHFSRWQYVSQLIN